ncbi:hypothetical protein ACK31S_17855 [Aeromonas caviae]
MDGWVVKYQLLNSSAEYVFEWLKSTADENGKLSVFLGEDREVLEFALLARNENLINLGLALFCLSPSVCFQLYKSGDHTIKRAVLSGLSLNGSLDEFGHEAWVITKSVIPELIYSIEKNNSDDDFQLISSVLCNKKIPDEILLSLYKKEGLFSNVSDELWLDLLWCSINNPRIATTYEGYTSDVFGGFDEYRYNRVFHTAWALYEHLPATPRNARFLGLLSAKLVPETYKLNFKELVEKWVGSDEYFFDARKNLVKTLGNYNDDFKALRDSGDLALRLGFYENLRYPSLSDFQAYLDLDGERFLIEAVHNNSFYCKEELRYALSSACSDVADHDSVISLSEKYCANLNKFKAISPDSFFDCEFEEELPFDVIDDIQVRTEVGVRFLRYKISKFSSRLEELLEKESTHGDVAINVSGIKPPYAYSLLWIVVFVLFLMVIFK